MSPPMRKERRACLFESAHMRGWKTKEEKRSTRVNGDETLVQSHHCPGQSRGYGIVRVLGRKVEEGAKNEARKKKGKKKSPPETRKETRLKRIAHSPGCMCRISTTPPTSSHQFWLAQSSHMLKQVYPGRIHLFGAVEQNGVQRAEWIGHVHCGDADARPREAIPQTHTSL